MSGEEWGAETTGPRIAAQDDMVMAQRALGNAKTLQEIPETQARTALYTGQAREASAKATQAELESKAMQTMSQLMAARAAGGGAAPGQGPSANDPNYNPGYEMASIAEQSGAFNLGMKLRKDAVTQDMDRANAERYKAVAEHDKALNDKMHIERFAGAAAGALQSQDAYQNFLMNARSSGFNVPQNMPPDLESARPMLQGWVNQGMTASQIATQHIAEMRLDQQRETAATQERLANARIAGIDTQMDYTKARKDDLVKNGGARAEAALEASKELTTLRRQRQQAEQLKTAGKTPTNPLAIPLKEGKPDAGKLTPGGYYTNGRGQVGEWDGKQMLLVQAPKGAPVRGVASAPAAVASEEDDAED